MTLANEPSQVTVVVASYNTIVQLRRCLSCIEDRHDVIVVDNASGDGSAEMVETEFPRARLIRNGTNRGFGAANNQGIVVAERPFVLLLNSDAYASPGSIDLLASVLDRPGVVAVGGKLLNSDGSVQRSTANSLTLFAVFCEQTLVDKAFPNSRALNPYWNTHRLGDSVAETQQVMGACLMMRPLETFDERFFLYCEDTDLCHRLRRHGVILYVPEAEFVHELGASSAADRWLAIARYNSGKELYFAIHRGRMAWLACWILNRCGALLRLIAWAVAIPFKGRRAVAQVRLFRKVLFAPVRGYSRPS